MYLSVVGRVLKVICVGFFQHCGFGNTVCFLLFHTFYTFEK